MSRLYEEVRNRLDVIEKMYDVIRIVEPINKRIINIKDNEIDIQNGSCYDYWKRGETCNNCISSKAYAEDIVFAKMERNDSNTTIVSAIPITINRERYVVEMLKNIGTGEKIFESDDEDKVIKNELIELFNVFYREEIKNFNTEIEEDFIEISEDKILVLENKIDELRDSLNELCELPDKIGKDNEILIMSQELDELIVEYMKAK